MLAVAAVWAVAVGSAFAVVVIGRSDRQGTHARFGVLERPLRALEKLEALTMDVRLRQLETFQRAPNVVVAVAGDASRQALEMYGALEATQRPWGPETYAMLVDGLCVEGASAVALAADPAVPPRTSVLKDDSALRAALVAHPAAAITTFLERAPQTAMVPPLRPFLVRVSDGSNVARRNDTIRLALSLGVPVYAVERPGAAGLWVAGETEARAQKAAAALGAVPPLVARTLVPDDEASEVDASFLTREASALTVPGLAVDDLPELAAIAPPHPAISGEPTRSGSRSFDPELDGTVRGVQYFFAARDGAGRKVVLPSAALLTAWTSLGRPELRVADGRLHLGTTVSVPIDHTGFGYLAWTGASVRALPVWRVLVNAMDKKRGDAPRFDNSIVQGVVIVGDDVASSPARTPVGTERAEETTARLTDAILTSDGIERASATHDAGLALLGALVGALCAVAASSRRRASALSQVGWLLLGIASHVGISIWVLEHDRRWIALSAPVLSMVFTFYGAQGYGEALEQRFRELVSRTLGRRLHPDVLAFLQRNVGLMRPIRRTVSVCVTDLAGFTAATREEDPIRLMESLQEHWNDATAAVLESRGQVDKYVGDRIVAFWGAPLPERSHPGVAARVVLELKAAFERRARTWTTRGLTHLSFHVGLDVGTAVVGEMGTEHLTAYSVLGEPVAMAGRLSALAKAWKVTALATQRFQEAAAQGLVFREIDRVRFGERSERVFELCGRLELPWHTEFAAAREKYLARDFAAAAEAFTRIAGRDGDPVSERLAARCREFQRAPPPADWDGAVAASTLG